MRQFRSRLAQYKSVFGKHSSLQLFQFGFDMPVGLQVSGDVSSAAGGGFEIEYDGSHVGQPPQACQLILQNVLESPS